MPVETTGAPETEDAKDPKNTGAALAIIGGFLTATVVLSPIGIPLLLFGLYTWYKHR